MQRYVGRSLESFAFLSERHVLLGLARRPLDQRELQALGVARVSTGPFTQRVALTALQDAAADVLAGGVLPPGTRPLN